MTQSEILSLWKSLYGLKHEKAPSVKSIYSPPIHPEITQKSSDQITKLQDTDIEYLMDGIELSFNEVKILPHLQKVHFCTTKRPDSEPTIGTVWREDGALYIITNLSCYDGAEPRSEEWKSIGKYSWIINTKSNFNKDGTVIVKGKRKNS